MTNPENLPIKVANRDVVVPLQQSGSLVARGLAAIQNSKGLAPSRNNDELYRQARTIFDQAEVGTDDGEISDWSEKNNPALFSAFKILQRLASNNYGKAYYPLSVLCGAKDNIIFLEQDEEATLKRIPIGKQYMSQQIRLHRRNKPQFQCLSKLAFEWCFANQNNVDVELWCDLGYLYLNGYGVARDEVQAETWFRKASEQGHVRAQYMMGCVAEGDAKRAQWYLMAADHGDADAQSMMGLLCNCGIAEVSLGVTKDEAKAAQYYLKAAEQGHPSALREIAKMYSEGCGVEKNDQQALYWFRKGAEQGDFLGQWHLGSMYSEGRGVERDEEKAVYWFRKAAEQEYRDAQIALEKLGIDWKRK
ncbi:MAG: tetratricopeptide repeat protein [Burkholderiaceae bacterium]|nr:tetratricopeptide repeat protein [Burkholderiaceae bacterium]